MFDCGYKSQYIGGQREKFVRYKNVLYFGHYLLPNYLFSIYLFLVFTFIEWTVILKSAVTLTQKI